MIIFINLALCTNEVSAGANPALLLDNPNFNKIKSSQLYTLIDNNLSLLLINFVQDSIELIASEFLDTITLTL